MVARAFHLQVVNPPPQVFAPVGQLAIGAASRFGALAGLGNAHHGGAKFLVKAPLLGDDAARREEVVNERRRELTVGADHPLQFRHLPACDRQAPGGVLGVGVQGGGQLPQQARDLLFRGGARFGGIARGLQPGIEAGHDVVGNFPQAGAQLFQPLVALARGAAGLRHRGVVGAHLPLHLAYRGVGFGMRLLQARKLRRGGLYGLLAAAPQAFQLRDLGGRGAVPVAVADHAALALRDSLPARGHPFPGVAAGNVHAVELALELHHLRFHAADAALALLRRLQRPAALGAQLVVAFLRLRQVALDGGLPRLQLAQANQLQVALGAEHPLLQSAVLIGAFHLIGEEVAGTLDLGDDRFNLVHVAAGLLQLALRFHPARAVPRDSGRLVEYLPPLLGLGREQQINPPLLHHRVGVLAYPGVQKQLAQVAQPHRPAVHQVLALARPVQPAAQLDLGDVDRQRLIVVLQYQRDLCHSHATAAFGTAEDHVFHALGAQGARVLLAECPAYGIDDVALAAAVGADDRRDSRREVYDGPLRKRFEAEQLDSFEEGHLPVRR